MVKMGRNTKYQGGTEILSLSIDKDVREAAIIKAKEMGISVSEMVTNILRSYTFNELDYARMMMKKHNREFYFWKSQKEALESTGGDKSGKEDKV